MKQPDRGEIDFETGKCVITLQSNLACFAENLKRIRNPYTGNKRKLLIDLFTAIDNKGWKFDTFVDVFSGSGMVAAAARHLGKNVVANDLSPYAYFNARFFLEVDEELDQEDIKWLTEKWHDDYLANPLYGFVKKNYAERFAPSEVEWLDKVRFNTYLYLPGGTTGYNPKAVLADLSVLHYVMDHCFVGGRLNKGQVLAELGHRVSHQRNQGKLMSFKDIDWLKPWIKGQRGTALNMDALQLFEYLEQIKYEADIAYIDPPYGGQQSNYAEMYKFFNDYLGGMPEGSEKQAERFVKTKGYNEQFADLLDAATKIPRLVFSYNDSSWCKIEDIVESIKRFRKDVSVEEVDYSYGYRDQSDPAKEYIILAE